MIKLDNLERVLGEISIELREKYKQKLTESDRIATGNLVNSVSTTMNIDGMEIDIDLNLEDYWKYVEDGTKPHWPPMNKILEWIKAKPVLPHPDKNGKLPSEKQLAYLISRKISIEGTEGKPDLKEAMEITDNDYKDRITEALDADMMTAIDDILKFKL